MVLARLRKETAALHEVVEARIDLLSPGLTLERYIRILQVFYTFFSQCENELDSTCPERWRALRSQRWRAERLQSDLQQLSAAPVPSYNCESSTSSLSIAGRWLGALYVVEGSALGGQVISRHLEKHFGWREGRGYSYFLGYGEHTGARWKQVCAAIETSADECNQIVEGAHLIFNRLKVCLETTL